MKSQIKSILIPTDFSELSENALKVGISIAKRQNAEIKLFMLWIDLHIYRRQKYTCLVTG